MDAEELRTDLIRDADKLTDSKVASLWAGRETVRRVKALRNYWQTAPAAELQRLAALLEQEPRRK